MFSGAITSNHSFFTCISSFSTTFQSKPSRMSDNPNKTLIFCYGTLKRGFGNHSLMQDLISHRDAAFVGDYVTTTHLPLVLGPYGVPFLLNLPGSSRHRIHGELYSVSDSGLQRLDDLEGITLGHYGRLPITLTPEIGEEMVEAEAYYAHRSFAAEMWRKCGEKGYDVYSEELAKNYVKRDLRPKDRSLRDHIALFCSSD